jgi:hypothetical protein
MQRELTSTDQFGKYGVIRENDADRYSGMVGFMQMLTHIVLFLITTAVLHRLCYGAGCDQSL